MTASSAIWPSAVRHPASSRRGFRRARRQSQLVAHGDQEGLPEQLPRQNSLNGALELGEPVGGFGIGQRDDGRLLPSFAAGITVIRVRTAAGPGWPESANPFGTLTTNVMAAMRATTAGCPGDVFASTIRRFAPVHAKSFMEVASLVGSLWRTIVVRSWTGSSIFPINLAGQATGSPDCVLGVQDTNV